MESEKEMYLLKQSDGSIWNFIYDKNLRITYKIYKENKWSNYHILTRESTGKYSISLLANDNICVIYESFDKHLVLKIYNNKKWTSYDILENDNDDKIEIYFKTIINKNNLILFYSTYNRYSKDLTICSSSIDDKGILHSLSLIDTIKVKDNILLSPSSSDNEIIYVMYQKKADNYILGYKVLDNYSMTWSKFYKVDESSSPFKEYNLLSCKEKFHSIYTKIDTSDNYSLNYYNCTTNKHININIILNKNIYSSSLFISDKYIWCFWISNNELFSTVSMDEGLSFSKSYKTESIDYLKIYKVTYLSNSLENKNLFFLGEVFAFDIHSPKLLVIDNIFGLVYKYTENTSYSLYFPHFISLINTNNNYIKTDFKEKDIIIENQNNVIEAQNAKLISYKNKFNSINYLLKEFNENRLKLNEYILFLQDSVDNKEKTINEYEIELELLRKENKINTSKKVSKFNIKEALLKLLSIFRN